MRAKIVNLRTTHISENVELENDKVYKVLRMISIDPCCRSAFDKKLPNSWRVLKNVLYNGFIERRSDYKYYITEDGLDKIDEIKLKYGLNIV